jgi:hypothetical protein
VNCIEISRAFPITFNGLITSRRSTRHLPDTHFLIPSPGSGQFLHSSPIYIPLETPSMTPPEATVNDSPLMSTATDGIGPANHTPSVTGTLSITPNETEIRSSLMPSPTYTCSTSIIDSFWNTLTPSITNQLMLSNSLDITLIIDPVKTTLMDSPTSASDSLLMIETPIDTTRSTLKNDTGSISLTSSPSITDQSMPSSSPDESSLETRSVSITYNTLLDATRTPNI